MAVESEVILCTFRGCAVCGIWIVRMSGQAKSTRFGWLFFPEVRAGGSVVIKDFTLSFLFVFADYDALGLFL